MASSCRYHPDFPIPDKFSTCKRCAAEFFTRHQRRLDVGNEVVEIMAEDIIRDLDEMLERKPK